MTQKVLIALLSYIYTTNSFSLFRQADWNGFDKQLVHRVLNERLYQSL